MQKLLLWWTVTTPDGNGGGFPRRPASRTKTHPAETHFRRDVPWAGPSGCRFDEVQFSVAMLAGDLGVEVFPRGAQFDLAMRAVGEESDFFDPRVVEVQVERGFAEFAFHALPAVLAVDTQLALAVRTTEEKSSG